MVAVYKMDGAYYFDEVLYDTGMTNQVAAQLAIDKGINRSAQCYADSAEPKSIREMQLEGINVMACDSKQDIRTYSIKKLQGATFYVSAESSNIIHDLEHYKWAEDKNGQSTGKPIKDHDHSIDAIIYFIGTDDKYSGEY
jgi:phage terminase large subunit